MTAVAFSTFLNRLAAAVRSRTRRERRLHHIRGPEMLPTNFMGPGGRAGPNFPRVSGQLCRPPRDVQVPGGQIQTAGVLRVDGQTAGTVDGPGKCHAGPARRPVGRAVEGSVPGVRKAAMPRPKPVPYSVPRGSRRAGPRRWQRHDTTLADERAVGYGIVVRRASLLKAWEVTPFKSPAISMIQKYGCQARR
jgi:hypothetical protein